MIKSVNTEIVYTSKKKKQVLFIYRNCHISQIVQKKIINFVSAIEIFEKNQIQMSKNLLLTRINYH